MKRLFLKKGKRGFAFLKSGKIGREEKLQFPSERFMFVTEAITRTLRVGKGKTKKKEGCTYHVLRKGH